MGDPTAQPDIYSLITAPDEASAGEQAKALAASLRRDRAYGMLASMGNPMTAGFARPLERGADLTQQELSQAPKNRAVYALDKEKQAQINDRRIALADPRTAKVLQETLKFYHPAGNFDGLPSATAEFMLPILEKGYASREAHAARLEAQAARAAGEDSGIMSDDAITMAAYAYLQNGNLPPIGRGKAGDHLRQKILQRASQLGGGTPDVAGNMAQYQADTKSLAALTTQNDQLSAFERTGKANLQNYLDAAKKLKDLGVPLANTVVRGFQDKVLGDPNVRGADAARTVAMTEISKILNGSYGAQAVSDSARHEAMSLIGPGATHAQIIRAAELLLTDMHNRMASNAAQIAAINQRRSSRVPVPGSASQPAGDPSTDASLRSKYRL